MSVSSQIKESMHPWVRRALIGYGGVGAGLGAKALYDASKAPAGNTGFVGSPPPSPTANSTFLQNAEQAGAIQGGPRIGPDGRMLP